MAGVEDVGVVSSADALLATYRNKHPATDFAPGTGAITTYTMIDKYPNPVLQRNNIAHESSTRFVFRANDVALVSLCSGEVHHVLLVEVGHSQSSVLLAAVTAAGSTLLSEASDVAFGAANFDDRLFRHFQAEIQNKYKGEVKPGRWGHF